jgi:predicted nucleotidyltransferase component of viral defense system
MISVRQLREASKASGLNLYQQEKEYCLKLFLFYYYANNKDAVFKGGTCLRFLFGIDRFSEDLDFNLNSEVDEFKAQVSRTLRDIGGTGMAWRVLKEEVFESAYTSEIAFAGPLSLEGARTENKIRIDAGRRTGTLLEPQWRLISSEYPETRSHFPVLTMDEREILVEKAIALTERRKGRDLYDAWYLLQERVVVDADLYWKKGGKGFDPDEVVTKAEYERDMKRLTRRLLPYEQLLNDVASGFSGLRNQEE